MTIPSIYYYLIYDDSKNLKEECCKNVVNLNNLFK